MLKVFEIIIVVIVVIVMLVWLIALIHWYLKTRVKNGDKKEDKTGNI